MGAQEFTLHDMLRRNAFNHADRLAVIHEQEQLTFRDFLARVGALATGLAGSCAGRTHLCVSAESSLLSRALRSEREAWAHR